MFSDRIAAALVASAVVVIAFFVGLYLYFLASDGIGASVGGAARALFFFLFFGWPVAFGVVLVAGPLGLRVAAARAQPISATVIGLVAGLFGFIAWPLVWRAFWGNWGGTLHVGIMGALAGLLGGVSYWRLIREPLTWK